MAKINEGSFRDWNDGETVKARDYKQEREIIRVAVNDTHDRFLDEQANFQQLKDVVEENMPKIEAFEEIASEVEQKGNYALAQGDYAKGQGNAIQEALEKSVNIIKQPTVPSGIVEGRIWADTSDNTYQGTVFEELSTQLAQTETKIQQKFINVRQPPYNVKNDGTIETQSIQQVLNDIESGEVFFPKGVYRVGRGNNAQVALDLLEKKGVTITGNDAEIIVDVDISNNHFSLLRLLGCEDITIKGIKFTVNVTGSPTVRRNCRIVNVTTSPESTSVDQTTLEETKNINIDNNEFHISHPSYTNSDLVSLYGIHAHTPETGQLRLVKGITFTNNTFYNSDGRLFMTYLVDGVICTGNKFFNCGAVNMAFVLRIIGASKNVFISENYIEVGEGHETYGGSATAMQFMGGISGSSLPDHIANIHSENYQVFNNIVVMKRRYNQELPNGAYIVGMKNLNIKGNTFIQLNEGGTSTRGEGIRLIQSSAGLDNENVVIKDNDLIGWLIWFFRNDDGNLVNGIVENNNIIGNTASNAFYDPSLKLIRRRNRSQFHNRNLEENGGIFTTSGNGAATSLDIPHGLGRTPSSFFVSERNNNTGFASIRYYFADATNIKVYFTNALPSGTNNISMNWRAEL